MCVDTMLLELVDNGLLRPEKINVTVPLAAIECDGATYHSALSVRDRDRIRQEILESLGWRGRIWRIWSTDWFRTPRQESEKLINFLEYLRESWKPEHISGDAWIEEGQGAGHLTARVIQQIEPVENRTVLHALAQDIDEHPE